MKLCNHYHYLIPDPKAGWKHIALIGSWILTWGNAWTSGRVGFTLKLLDWNLMWIFAVKKETHSSPKTTVINQKNLYLTKSCRTQGLSQRWLSLLSGLSLWPKLKILLFLPFRPAPLLRIFLTFFFFDLENHRSLGPDHKSLNFGSKQSSPSSHLLPYPAKSLPEKWKTT